MMKRLWLSIFVLLLGLFVSCTLQDIKKGVEKMAPKLLQTIATAYGGHYSALISEFFTTASNIGGQEELPPEAYPQEVQYQETYVPEDESQWVQEDVAPIPQELMVDIDVVKEIYENGRYDAGTVMDGDTLTRNDNYKVLFRCNIKCYVYIAQLDATGKMDPIFPSEHVPWGNPAIPDTIYSVPPDRNWFFLDENTGVETIYFIVSRTRRDDIAQLFYKLTERNKTLVQQTPVSLDNAMIITRGIGGIRRGRKQSVNFQDGSQGQYSSSIFSSIRADFVVTRWFYHR